MNGLVHQTGEHVREHAAKLGLTAAQVTALREQRALRDLLEHR